MSVNFAEYSMCLFFLLAPHRIFGRQKKDLLGVLECLHSVAVLHKRRTSHPVSVLVAAFLLVLAYVFEYISVYIEHSSHINIISVLVT